MLDKLARGDENDLALRDAADAYIARNGLDPPEEPEARASYAQAECVRPPIVELDLTRAGIRTIIWATDHAVGFGWLQTSRVDGALPVHRAGSWWMDEASSTLPDCPVFSASCQAWLPAG